MPYGMFEPRSRVRIPLWISSLMVVAYGLNLCGCSSYDSVAEIEQALANVKEWELLSIEPLPVENSPSNLQGHEILGKMISKDLKLFANLFASMEDQTAAKACAFSPRHAVRAVAENRRFEILICFECGDVWVFVDGSLRNRSIGISKDLETTLDATLKSAGVPLAAKGEKETTGTTQPRSP